jgi:hypothetical protein
MKIFEETGKSVYPTSYASILTRSENHIEGRVEAALTGLQNLIELLTEKGIITKDELFAILGIENYTTNFWVKGEHRYITIKQSAKEYAVVKKTLIESDSYPYADFNYEEVAIANSQLNANKIIVKLTGAD